MKNKYFPNSIIIVSVSSKLKSTLEMSLKTKQRQQASLKVHYYSLHEKSHYY